MQQYTKNKFSSSKKYMKTWHLFLKNKNKVVCLQPKKRLGNICSIFKRASYHSLMIFFKEDSSVSENLSKIQGCIKVYQWRICFCSLLKAELKIIKAI